jgi:hypothetical protein
MPKLTMFSKPNMSPDVTVSGLKVLEAPKGWKFTAEVEFDAKIIKSVEKDSILLKEMNEAAGKAYKQTCDSVKGKYNAFEKLFQGMIDKGAPKAAIDQNIAGFNKALESDRQIGEIGATQAIEAVWKKWAAKNKEYTKYKVKIFVTVFGAASALAVSIGLMASAPFTGGASAAISIIGMWKSTLVLVKEIGSAAMEIEKSQKLLSGYMKVVEAAAKKGKAAAKANEYSAAIVKQFLGESQPSIKGCDSQLGTIKQKLTGVEVKTHDCSKTLNGILDAQEKLRAEFMKEVVAKLSKHPSKDAPSQIKLIESRLDKLLEGSYAKVMEFIDKTEKLHERFKTAEEVTVDLEKRVKPLMALRGLDNKILENVLYFVDMPLGALNGNAMATASSDLVQGLVPVAASMAYDKITGVVLDKTLLA